MNPYAIPPFLVTLVIGWCGVLVYLRNPTSKVHMRFSLFCLSMFIWLVGFVGLYLSRDNTTALWWARFGFIGITFIPVCEYHFILTFLGLRQLKRLAILYLLAFLGLPLSRTALVYKDIWQGFWGNYPSAGILYLPFPLTFACTFVGGMWFLYKALRQETQPARRQQIKYLLLAFACGTPGIIDYIAKYKIEIYPFGYITALFFIGIIAYAVVRHRLMDVRLALTRTSVLVGVYGVVVGAPLLVGLALRPLFFQLFHERWWLAPLGLYTVAAFAGPFLYLYFQRRAEDRLLMEQRRYQQTLLSASSGMTQIRELKQLIELIRLDTQQGLLL
jgi:hypothetical protein